jgi:DNA-directed RNA polymerase subunit RPC12/RpoP
MATTTTVRCPECDWSGESLELDDAHGEPACPDCGSRVTIR